MRFMHSENWDDLRFVLAVADTGTVSGAARKLGVNHATVLRRVAAYETRFGVAIFDRTPKGYTVRADRVRMIEAAREAEAALGSVTRMLQGEQAPVMGSVRVSSTDSLCQFVLPEIIGALHKDVSGLRIALMSTNARSDFSRAQADVAVRPTDELGEDMVGDVGARLGFGVYATDPAPDEWLGLAGPLTRSLAARWMAERVAPEKIVSAADSFVVLAYMAGIGLGRAVIPCVLGDADARLMRLDQGALPSAPIWVANHVDMAGVSRIEATRRYLLAGLDDMKDRLLGVTA
ncbi:LysR family transcriptional regulator [Shimia haliotis]|uniref:DNA-binding transcriptional regulator, LysR family n=1 Tax=Shimia haliotis TaxID=1280847 RepID=A0A1I4B7H6_9RHOB|nr:LysR family transcriptional regulator [Shimia haliotis]SFK64067.1 DNA-binding transcriptional regulator, LysR family [Shimia haliotis]